MDLVFYQLAALLLWILLLDRSSIHFRDGCVTDVRTVLCARVDFFISIMAKDVKGLAILMKPIHSVAFYQSNSNVQQMKKIYTVV